MQCRINTQKSYVKLVRSVLKEKKKGENSTEISSIRFMSASLFCAKMELRSLFQIKACLLKNKHGDSNNPYSY